VAKFTITCVAFKPVTRNTLRGFATIRVGELRMEIRELEVHEHENGARWVVPAGRPMIDKDGVALREPNGRIKYLNLFEFTDQTTRDAFSRAVIDALLRAFPNAFTPERKVAV
jgi:hypothetical protein